MNFKKTLIGILGFGSASLVYWALSGSPEKCIPRGVIQVPPLAQVVEEENSESSNSKQNIEDLIGVNIDEQRNDSKIEANPEKIQDILGVSIQDNEKVEKLDLTTLLEQFKDFASSNDNNSASFPDSNKINEALDSLGVEGYRQIREKKRDSEWNNYGNTFFPLFNILSPLHRERYLEYEAYEILRSESDIAYKIQELETIILMGHGIPQLEGVRRYVENQIIGLVSVGANDPASAEDISVEVLGNYDGRNYLSSLPIDVKENLINTSSFKREASKVRGLVSSADEELLQYPEKLQNSHERQHIYIYNLLEAYRIYCVNFPVLEKEKQDVRNKLLQTPDGWFEEIYSNENVHAEAQFDLMRRLDPDLASMLERKAGKR